MDQKSDDVLSPERFIRELWGIAPKEWFGEFFLIRYEPTPENPHDQKVNYIVRPVSEFLSDWKSVDNHLQYLNRKKVFNIHQCVNPRAKRPKKRGKNKDVSHYVTLWVDIDFHGTETASREDFRKNVQAFTEAGLAPSIIAESGHGLHAYWLLDKPYPYAEAHRCCAGLQDAFKADTVNDGSRVLRMPGTLNLKDPRNPGLCRVIEASYKRYALESFADYAVNPKESLEDLEEKKLEKELKSNKPSRNPNIELVKNEGVSESGGPFGGRHNTVKALAGHFASDPSITTLEAVTEKLRAWNSAKCNPPVEDKEVDGMARYAWEQETEKRKNSQSKRKEKKDRGDIEKYFNGKEFLPEILSRDICSKFNFIATPIDKSGTGSTIYAYKDGCFRPDGAHTARMNAHGTLDTEAKPGRIDNVIDLIRISKSIDYSMLNKKAKDLVNVANGMLDWRTGKLFAHSPEYVSTFQINAKWDPEAKSKAFDKFLSEVASPQDALFVEELMGYLMIPDTSFHKSFAFVGMPGTGKSTLLKLITTWLGDENVSAIPLQAIESNQFASSGLFGKLANICTELKSDAMEDVGMVKAISSGETITAEEKYQSRFSFEPFCRLVFSANEFPHVSDRKGAFIARMIFIEFENIFRGTKGEVKVYHQLLSSDPETFPAMLNRAVAGLRRLMENGRFTQSEASRRLATDYTRRCNSVLFFFEENCKTNVEGAWLARRDFYQQYHCWAKDHGLKPVSVHSCLEVIRSMRPGVLETFRDGYPGLKWVIWSNSSPPVTTRSEVDGFSGNRNSSQF